jgi:hypothetical protein
MEFDEIITTTLRDIESLLVVKGKEYVRGNNPFHNFDVAAKMNNVSAPDALHGMLTKHLVSYLDMLDDIKHFKQIEDKVVEEKFNDIITYFLLQKALIKERHTKPNF